MDKPDRISQHARDLQNAPPRDILRWALDAYRGRLAVVTSFQPTGIVTLHMLRDLAPGVPVLTLDTGNLFPETLALMDRLEREWRLNLVRIRPRQTLDEQAHDYGEALWRTQPDLCCHLRKVAPLSEALTGYDAWVTGIRRDQSDGRAETPVLGWDARNHKVKVAPFALWTDTMIWTYIHAHDLPYNPLHDRGYPSIGCTHCTQPVAPGETDPRAGRWANLPKTECGLHLPPADPRDD